MVAKAILCGISHGMGWLRLVGSLKLQVSFAEYGLLYRALLQKRPIILRSLLIVATPYFIFIYAVFYMYVYIHIFPSSTIFFVIANIDAHVHPQKSPTHPQKRPTNPQKSLYFPFPPSFLLLQI